MTEKTGKRSQENEFTFEEAFGKLGEMVQTLEGGNLSLEEATCLNEDGMKLAQKCNELLNHAELRINTIQESFGEQMRLLNSELTLDAPEDDSDPDTFDDKHLI